MSPFSDDFVLLRFSFDLFTSMFFFGDDFLSIADDSPRGFDPTLNFERFVEVISFVLPSVLSPPRYFNIISSTESATSIGSSEIFAFFDGRESVDNLRRVTFAFGFSVPGVAIEVKLLDSARIFSISASADTESEEFNSFEVGSSFFPLEMVFVDFFVFDFLPVDCVFFAGKFSEEHFAVVFSSRETVSATLLLTGAFLRGRAFEAETRDSLSDSDIKLGSLTRV